MPYPSGHFSHVRPEIDPPTSEEIVFGTLGHQDPINVLEKYTTNASLRQERGHAARNRAVSCFSADAMIRKYANLYDGCVAGLRKVAA
jgi:glycosyltransferase involved in cell wall biosynthesis